MKSKSHLRTIVLGTMFACGMLGVTVAAQAHSPATEGEDDLCFFAHVHEMLGMPPVCHFHKNE